MNPASDVHPAHDPDDLGRPLHRPEGEAVRGFFAGTVGRPVALAVAFATLIVVGLIAYARVPLQLFPQEFTEPELNIWVINPGSNARENEEQIARPIEEQLRTLAGIEETHSFSNDGVVTFRVQFQGNTDMDLARAEVRDRVERAWPSLPATAEPAQMWTESASSLPISFFGVTVRGDPSRRDYLLEKLVKPRLEAVSGIGKIDLWGMLQDSVRILLDEDKVVAAQLDIGGVIARLASDNFALPMGEVKDGGREIILRSDMRFQSVEEVANFPIGNGLRLKDVGRVIKAKSVSNMLALIDGDYAYYGMATKNSSANIVDTSHALRAAMKEIEADPATGGDVTINPFFVQGDFIESALQQLGETALYGGLLAVVVLFVFLRRVRLTVCVALSIPVSVLIAVAWIYFTGSSFNLLTMTGITLGIGMLVDNAVVVVENISRIRARGEHALTSAVLGTRQIALAVTLATLTTVVVFLPLIFMTDNQMMRIVFGNIGIPLSVSLLGSLFVAVIFLPVITARFLGAEPGQGRIEKGMERVLRIPARGVAHLVGGVRFLWFALVRGLHVVNRLVLALLTPLRWLLVAGAVALAAWLFLNLGATFRPGTVLEEFGLRVGLAPEQLYGVIVLALLATVLPLVFGVRAWRRRPGAAPAWPQRFVPEGDSVIDMVTRLNHDLVAWTLKNRLLAVLLAFLAFLSIGIPRSLMEVTAFGQDSVDGDADFRVIFETDFTLAEAEKEIRAYTEYVESQREEIGYEHWTCRFDEGGGEFSIHFGEGRPDAEVEKIERRLKEELPRIPGHRLVFYSENDSNSRTNTVARFALRGPDSRELERLGARAQEILERVPGLSEVTSPLARAPEMIEVQVDREKALDFGVTTEAIQNTIAWTLRGWPLPRYQEEGRELPLIIEYDEEENAGVTTLRELAVFAQTGMIPLSSFANLSFTRGTRSIYRRNGETSFELEAKLDDPLQVIPVTEAAYSALGQLELPRGFSWDRTDSAQSRTEAELAELQRAFWFSLALVFLLMGILFESVLLPFSVLFTIPFALMGSFWTLYLTGTPMDSFGWIGMIILAGVVVNNGIVLIDRIHGLRKSLDRDRAVIEGCGHRVRPVLMTALTTVCGLFPMAISEPPQQSMVDYRALATIVAGGLIASTFFTLWVVPLAYTVIDDLSHVLLRWLRWWVRRPARSSQARTPVPEPSR